VPNLTTSPLHAPISMHFTFHQTISIMMVSLLVFPRSPDVNAFA
jgi:hypothetical protein